MIGPFFQRASTISHQPVLRCDPKYRYFWDMRHGIVIGAARLVALRDILTTAKRAILKKGDLAKDYLLLEIQSSVPRDGQLYGLPLVAEIGSDKLDLSSSDLIISKLGSTRGYIFDNTLKGQRLAGSTELIPYNLIDDEWLAEFIKFVLLLPEYLEASRYLQSGKTPSHWRVNPGDLLNVRIPYVTKEDQVNALAALAPLQSRINDLRATTRSTAEIVDEAFAGVLGYSIEEYSEKQHTYFVRRYSDLGKEISLRSSAGFQHPRFEYAREKLAYFQGDTLRSLCAEKIRRGVQPEYDASGDVLVISTATLRHGGIDLSEARSVSVQFLKENDKAKVRCCDIVVSSTGEGRGKVDIYEEGEVALADSHISVISLKPEVNARYVFFFMHSLLGRLQIRMLELAVKGTPEIYPYQLEKLCVPRLRQSEVEVVVADITRGFQERRRILADVAAVRTKIDDIVRAVF